MRMSAKMSRMIAEKQGTLKPLDHKAIGKELKRINRYLMDLSTNLYNLASKPNGRKASASLRRAERYIGITRALLDTQHSWDDGKDFDTHTYYGDDRE